MDLMVGWITNIEVKLVILGKNKKESIGINGQDSSMPGEGSSRGKLGVCIPVSFNVKARIRVVKFNNTAG